MILGIFGHIDNTLYNDSKDWLLLGIELTFSFKKRISDIQVVVKPFGHIVITLALADSFTYGSIP